MKKISTAHNPLKNPNFIKHHIPKIRHHSYLNNNNSTTFTLWSKIQHYFKLHYLLRRQTNIVKRFKLSIGHFRIIQFVIPVKTGIY